MIEKKLGLVTNIVLLIIVLVSVVFIAGGFLDEIFQNQQVKNIIVSLLEERGDYQLASIAEEIEKIKNFIVIVNIILACCFLVATCSLFLVKNKVILATIYVGVGCVIAALSHGILIPIYMLYFIVGIMFFIRKNSLS